MATMESLTAVLERANVLVDELATMRDERDEAAATAVRLQRHLRESVERLSLAVRRSYALRAELIRRAGHARPCRLSTEQCLCWDERLGC